MMSTLYPLYLICYNSIAFMDTLTLFSDPIISIAFLKLPEVHGGESFSMQETITCLVNATAGPPTLALLYHGPDKSTFNTTHQRLQLENHEYYHDGIKFATAILPQRGDIECEITDKLGTYRKTKHIEKEGMFLVN